MLNSHGYSRSVNHIVTPTQHRTIRPIISVLSETRANTGTLQQYNNNAVFPKTALSDFTK